MIGVEESISMDVLWLFIWWSFFSGIEDPFFCTSFKDSFLRGTSFKDSYLRYFIWRFFPPWYSLGWYFIQRFLPPVLHLKILSSVVLLGVVLHSKILTSGTSFEDSFLRGTSFKDSYLWYFIWRFFPPWYSWGWYFIWRFFPLWYSCGCCFIWRFPLWYFLF